MENDGKMKIEPNPFGLGVEYKAEGFIDTLLARRRRKISGVEDLWNLLGQIRGMKGADIRVKEWSIEDRYHPAPPGPGGYACGTLEEFPVKYKIKSPPDFLWRFLYRNFVKPVRTGKSKEFRGVHIKYLPWTSANYVPKHRLLLSRLDDNDGSLLPMEVDITINIDPYLESRGINSL